MQAIIMAAGKGSRLGDLTKGMPKSFAEIKGKKLIEYNIDLLHSFGIRDIVIVTGYRNDAFEALLKDRDGIRLVYNPFYEMVNVLGSFFIAMEKLTDDFIYMHADTLCAPGILEKIMELEADINLPVEFSSCDEEAMKVRRENGKIVEISKQIPLHKSEGEFIGIASFRKEVIPAMKKHTKKLMEEKAFAAYFESTIQRLIDYEDFEIALEPTDGEFWCEIDFMEDYIRACKAIPEGLLTIT